MAFGAAFITIGAGLVSDADRYRFVAAYSALFRVAAPEVWGWVFIVAGALLAVPFVPRMVATCMAAGHMFAWSAGLVYANRVDHTATPTAWVWPLLLAVLLLLSPATIPP